MHDELIGGLLPSEFPDSVALSHVILGTRVDLPWLHPGLLIGGFLLLFATLIAFNYWTAKKRRDALQAIAGQLGLSFSPEKDRFLASLFSFLKHVASTGSSFSNRRNSYAFNVMSGTAGDGSEVRVFDYHYETRSKDSNGRSQTKHHYFSIFTLILPASFPELIIEPEGIFSKLGQALGFDDINFESMEFSRRFHVKSKDKKFAYDFCNGLMIDYLLQQGKLMIEVEGNVLALTFKGKLAIESIVPNYERLLRIRSLMPNYLFTA